MAKKAKPVKPVARSHRGSGHRCYWRTATIMLARCVVATIQADGKIGMGSGMVMRVDKNGRRTVERWDKDFIEALAFIGIEVGERPRQRKSTSVIASKGDRA